ncbi:hypothetical protein SAMN04487974_1396 [Pelagibacterium luteolum]|uniref:Uncharacterized protein n=1 Tax=Pelagibacterium luteolum TaxID=440168 RepID=A0A1G8ASF5_9HYPH|nr:hypothetical protein SAMN04487974_1396 [Pelagibacterium luteolum]
MDFDTPEPQTSICDSAFEVALVRTASARRLELLTANEWTVETSRTKRSNRTLAIIRLDGKGAGYSVTTGGLARHGQDCNEWWWG